MHGEVNMLDVLTGLGLQEQHVFQQVGHAGFAVSFEARTNHVRHVDGHVGLGGIREQQHVEPVGQGVFGDALDGGDLLHAFGQGLGKRRERKNQEQGEQCFVTSHESPCRGLLDSVDELDQETFRASSLKNHNQNFLLQ